MSVPPSPNELRAPAGLSHRDRRAWARERMDARRAEERTMLRGELRRRARRLGIGIAIVSALTLLVPTAAMAAGTDNEGTHQFIQLALTLGGLSLLPFAVMTLTSFLRIVVVLSFLRSGLGAQNVPPNMVIIALALFLSLFVMGPTIEQINTTAIEPAMREKNPISYDEALMRAQVPLKKFMVNQMQGKGSKDEIRTFYKLAVGQKGSGSSAVCPEGDTSRPDECLANKEQVKRYGPEVLPTRVIIPAFMISELKKAFLMGFAVLLPFLVIDMVISNILLSLGMFMLPPVVISLPFKILLFIIAGGWNVVIEMLAKGFNYG